MGTAFNTSSVGTFIDTILQIIASKDFGIFSSWSHVASETIRFNIASVRVSKNVGSFVMFLRLYDENGFVNLLWLLQVKLNAAEIYWQLLQVTKS